MHGAVWRQILAASLTLVRMKALANEDMMLLLDRQDAAKRAFPESIILGSLTFSVCSVCSQYVPDSDFRRMACRQLQSRPFSPFPSGNLLYSHSGFFVAFLVFARFAISRQLPRSGRTSCPQLSARP
jgi:hypothetical protein